MDKDELLKFITMMTQNDSNEMPKHPHNMTVEQLAKKYLVRDTFLIGDKVVHKKGFADTRNPGEEEYGVVVEVLDEPLIDVWSSHDSSYFGRPLDVRIGFKCKNSGVFLCYFHAHPLNAQMD